MTKRISHRLVLCLVTVTASLPITSNAYEKWQPSPPWNYFTVNGYIDGSYNYLSRKNIFTSGIPDRAFDVTENGFTLQQASLTIANQPAQGAGGLVNFMIGRDAYGLAPYGWNPSYDSQMFGFLIPQIFIQDRQGDSTLILGQFYSLSGFEGADPTEDTNFSRALVATYAQPGTLMGVRNTYKPNNTWSLIVGVNDGWDTIRDFSRRKTLEIGAAFTPGDKYSLYVQIYSGSERVSPRVDSGPVGNRNLLDIYGTWKINHKLSLSFNYDYGMQSKTKLPGGNLAHAYWTGIAGYLNYKFDEQWRTSFRTEIFSDPDGVRTGVKQAIKEATLTVAYAPRNNMEIRAETRRDISNVNSYIDLNGRGTSNNLQSFSLEAYYKFG